MPEPAFGVARSFSGRRWLLKPVDLELESALLRELPPVVARLLALRGVPLAQAADYLAPRLKKLPTPVRGARLRARGVNGQAPPGSETRARGQGLPGNSGDLAASCEAQERWCVAKSDHHRGDEKSERRNRS